MLFLTERWCDFSPRTRLGVWLAMVLLMAIAVSLSRRTGRIDVQPVPLKLQWRKMMSLRDVSSAMPTEVSKPFSALEFDGAGRRLVSWQPSGKGGELVLEAQWPTVPLLFSALAEQRQAVREFSIQPGEGHLRLTLTLEAIDDE